MPHEKHEIAASFWATGATTGSVVRLRGQGNQNPSGPGRLWTPRTQWAKYEWSETNHSQESTPSQCQNKEGIGMCLILLPPFGTCFSWLHWVTNGLCCHFLGMQINVLNIGIQSQNHKYLFLGTTNTKTVGYFSPSKYPGFHVGSDYLLCSGLSSHFPAFSAVSEYSRRSQNSPFVIATTISSWHRARWRGKWATCLWPSTRRIIPILFGVTFIGWTGDWMVDRLRLVFGIFEVPWCYFCFIGLVRLPEFQFVIWLPQCGRAFRT